MRKLFISAIALGFMSLISLPSLAQDEENKIKIDVTVTKDGKTKHIVKEIDLTDADNLKEIMDQVDGLEDIDISVEDGAVEVIVRKKGDGNVSAFSFPGVNYYNTTKGEKTAFMGIIGNNDGDRVVLSKIIKDGPAEKAGFEAGDVVLEFDGQDVATYDDLVKLIHSKEIGDKVKVKVDRDGKTKKLNLELGERESDIRIFNGTVQGFPHSSWSMDNDKLRLKLDKELAQLKSYNSDKGFLGVHYSLAESNDGGGIFVTKIVEESAADESGILADDILIKLNGEELKSSEVFSDLMNKTKKGDEVELVIKRGDETITKKVTLGERTHSFHINGFNMKNDDMNFFFDSDNNFDFGDKVMVKVLVEKISTEEEAMIHQALGINSSNEFENVDIKIYPNPGEGKFKFEFNSEGVESLDIHVFDEKGSEIYTSKNTSNTGEYEKEIDITEFPSGVYFMAVKSGNKVFTEKLIKK